MVVEVVLPHVRTPEIGVPRKSDPEHVVGLPLVPVGRGVNVGHGSYHGLITLYGRQDPDRGPAKVHKLVGQLERALPVHDRDKGEVRDGERLPRRREHGGHVAGVGHDPHHAIRYLRFFEAVPVAEAVEVALQPGP